MFLVRVSKNNSIKRTYSKTQPPNETVVLFEDIVVGANWMSVVV
jgi:hypothetical protein